MEPLQISMCVQVEMKIPLNESTGAAPEFDARTRSEILPVNLCALGVSRLKGSPSNRRGAKDAEVHGPDARKGFRDGLLTNRSFEPPRNGAALRRELGEPLFLASPIPALRDRYFQSHSRTIHGLSLAPQAR